MKGKGLLHPEKIAGLEYNYAYYPVIFKSEGQLLRVKDALFKKEVNTRRYFYPSLNKLPYHTGNDCPVAEDIAKRVLCLPLYHDLTDDQVMQIVGIILNEI